MVKDQHLFKSLLQVHNMDCSLVEGKKPTYSDRNA